MTTNNFLRSFLLSLLRPALNIAALLGMCILTVIGCLIPLALLWLILWAGYDAGLTM